MKWSLSKSKYCTGLQCSKLLWVHYNDKERLPPFDSSVQARFDQGHVIGELAKSLYPGGVEIVYRSGAFREMVEETAKALLLRKPIFEATFSNDGAYAQADVLNPVENDAWDIIEVKSATRVKPVNLDDVAFQKNCYESAGLKIRRCFVMHINNAYVRQGEIAAKQLFTKTDVTDEIAKRQPLVRGNMECMVSVIGELECPDVKVGPHCSAPYACPLQGECWAFMPEDNVTTLYRVGAAKTQPLIEKGIYAIGDLPADFPLGDRAEIQRSCVLAQKPHVDKEAIRLFLSGLNFPQYHLDFETFQSVIPQYENTRPYQQIPFQFSLHIWKSFDSEPEHIEFLADGKADPRLEMLAELKRHIGPEGDVVAYNAGFEKGCLRRSAEAFPEYQSFVSALLPRFVDLLQPFRAFHYYHPSQRGSASIKKVLPALVPEFSYADMEIGDGMTASNEYARVTFGQVTQEDREQVREGLLKYCHLDTLAMIKIIQALRALIS